MPTRAPHLTLLVPCFDEGPRIDRLLEAARVFSAQRPALALEVICADDGSTDDTPTRLTAWSRQWPVLRVIRLEQNRGKGAALREGMARARGEAVVFLDADLAVDLRHVEKALGLLAEGADVVVGCRNVAGSSVARSQPFPRRWMGRVYRRCARTWLGLRVADVTCGFKAFRRETGQRLFERSACRRWGFDAEVLFLAQRAGCTVREMPVRWFDGQASSVRLTRDVPGALRDLVLTRLRHAFRRAPTIRGETPAPRLREVAATSAQDG